MAKYPRILKIKLINYRNHGKLSIDCKKNFIFLEGKNGSGKTNVLEAISLLSSRSGFRNSELKMILSKKNKIKPEEFGVNFNLFISNSESNIGIGLKNYENVLQRVTKLDGLNTNINIEEIIKVFWILPTMNNLFIGSSKDRRTFYDHMISFFTKEHKKMIKDYENVKKQRIKILKFFSLSQQNLKWLKILENKMCVLGILITENRIEFVNKINNLLLSEKNNLPSLRVNLSGGMSENFNKMTALKLEEGFANELYSFREIDKKTGRTNSNAISSDFTIYHNCNKLYDKDCSTGEQKIMLVSIVMAFIKLLQREGEKNIIFLLDDIFSTLDSNFIDILLLALKDLNIQTWITDVSSCVINKKHKIFEDTMFINIEDINI